jgi:arylsulfatase A-like enzyme
MKELFRIRLKYVLYGSVLLFLAGGCLDTAEVADKLITSVAEEISRVPENIVLISIDTLRADRLGSYGYPDGYSPTMDRLALNGQIQKTVYTVMPHTTPSHASLLTGLYPIGHGSRDNAIPLDDNVATLAQTLAAQGYDTAGSVGHFLLSAETSSLDRGFAFYRAPPQPGLESGVTEEGGIVYPLISNDFRPWRIVNKHARNWMSAAQNPWFLFLHYYECHAPYLPSHPWTKIPDLHPYDGEIAGIDHAIADVLKMITANSSLETTEVVITADHGESLGEHGYTGHGINLYFPSMRVPWISGDNTDSGSVQTGLRKIMDVMPTVLNDRNIPVPAGLDGVPDTDQITLVYGESPSLYPDEPQRRIRSVRNADFTLVYHRNANIRELYALQNDPGEMIDVSRRYPALKGSLTDQIETFVANDTDDLLYPEDVLEPPVKEALKALGYLTN